MAANEYQFVTRWLVDGDVREVAVILGDPLDLVRWWPSVYLDAREMQAGDHGSAGRRIELLTKGWLPYTLRWRFLITEWHPPAGFSLEAEGDFNGRGVWAFRQDGPQVSVIYDWRVRADKPLLRYLSLVFKPMFAANHRWAMAMGERSLKLELARRHAKTPGELARIAAPPGPTPASPVAFLVKLPVLLLRGGS